MDNDKKQKLQEIVTESIVALRDSTTTTVPELTQLNRLAEIDVTTAVSEASPIVCLNCQQDLDRVGPGPTNPSLVRLQSLAKLKTSSKGPPPKDALQLDDRRKVEQLVSLRLQALKDNSSSLDYPDLSPQDLSQIQQISESELQEIVFAKVSRQNF